MSDVPELPDANTLRAVSKDFELAAETIDAVHLGDVTADQADDLRELREDLWFWVTKLRDKAEEIEEDRSDE